MPEVRRRGTPRVLKTDDDVQALGIELMGIARTEELYAALERFKAETRASVLRGKVALCSKGRPGVVVSCRMLPWGWSFTGFALDDGPIQWASRDPQVVFSCLDEYLRWHDARHRERINEDEDTRRRMRAEEDGTALQSLRAEREIA